MKAMVITKPGPPDVLQLRERPVPVRADDEVLIRVKAAGINRPDVAQRQGKYPAPAGAPPDIPGLEVAGIIEECGKEDSQWKRGDEVCALLSGGGYAEFAVAPAGQCLAKPEGLGFAEAASMPETLFTVWNNVFERGALQAGDNFLVHGGSSGIGVTAIQLAKAIGARVFTTAGTDEKVKACMDLGADIAINYRKDDFEKVLEPEGVDVILDMIGGDYVPRNLRLLRADGRMVFINAMKGSSIDLNIGDIMKKRISITGSTLRNRDVYFKSALATEIKKHVWPMIGTGNFKPVIYKTFPLDAAARAHELMESSSHIGKIVLILE